MPTTLDPFVFYRDFSVESPITTGAQHLSAAATRLALSIVGQALFGDDAVAEVVEQRGGRKAVSVVEFVTAPLLGFLGSVTSVDALLTMAAGPGGAPHLPPGKGLSPSTQLENWNLVAAFDGDFGIIH